MAAGTRDRLRPGTPVAILTAVSTGTGMAGWTLLDPDSHPQVIGVESYPVDLLTVSCDFLAAIPVEHSPYLLLGYLVFLFLTRGRQTHNREPRRTGGTGRHSR